MSGQIIAILAKVTSKIWFSKGTIPKCPRNSGYLRITVICPGICLLLLIYCTFFLKVQIWINHSTQPPAPCSSFATTSCHNTNEPPLWVQQEPVYPDSDWQQRMLEDELPLELPVGARRRELGRFRESGAVDGTWEILGVCATLAANLYGIFS